VDAAMKDGVLVLKRFSGGGTVVVDHDSLWTTFIGRNEVKVGVSTWGSRECVKLNLRETMEWSADIVFDPTFDRWNEKIDGRKSSGSNK
jgi:lipoate-protein ligase A